MSSSPAPDTVQRHLRVALIAVALMLGTALGATATIGNAATLNLSSQQLTPTRTCVVTATPSGTTSVIDASVRQATASTNYGTSTTNDVASATSSNRRLYIKFDLSGCVPTIATGATVRVATLRMYMSALPAACRTLDLFRVAATWSESLLTWTNQPFGTALNNPATSSRTDSFDVGTPTGCQNRSAGYVSGADVTTDVAAFVAGSATNNGWMIRDDTESSTTARTTTFSAKNLGTLAQAPQLVVTYVTVP